MDMYVNWEIIADLVDPVHWIQFANTCWVFGLTRHMNVTCRIALLISRRESLSMSHFISTMQRMDMLLESLAIPGLHTAVPFLTVTGLILEADFNRWCDRIGLPLPMASRFPRFVVSEMRIHRLHQYQSSNEFEAAFFAALNYSPVAAVIPCYPSLDLFRFQQHLPDYGIYSPPVDELIDSHTDSHMIFATGRGRLLGIPFVQFRDSADGGFLNVRMGWGIITQFVELIGPRVVW